MPALPRHILGEPVLRPMGPDPGQGLGVQIEIGRRGLDNVEFVVGDVHALDFPDDTFDVVHAH